MADNDDLDLISGYSDLAKKSRIDPKQRYLLNVLEGDTGGSNLGILAKGLAGAMLARQAGAEMDQIRQLQAIKQQQQNDVLNYVEESEKQGLSKSYIKRGLFGLFLKQGNKFAEEAINSKVFSDADENDPINQFNDYVKLRKGMSKADFDKDPTYMYLKGEADKVFSQKFGAPSGVTFQAGSGIQASPTAGTRQDQNQDVNGLDDLMKQVQAPELDRFTGKPTTKGRQQEAKNKIITSRLLKESGSSEERSQIIKDSAADVLKTITEIEKGINSFGFFGDVPSIPGTKRVNWEANVNKLLAGKIIQLMTDMKSASKTGATGFGQLSNKELEVLRQSSTALKRGLSPKDAKRYLSDMKVKLQKIAGEQNGNIQSFDSEEEAEASGVKGTVLIGGRKARID